MTDPIVGDWEKSVMFAGRMHCRFYPDNTGVAIGRVLGYDINEPFTWTCKGNGVYHICAAGHEHDNPALRRPAGDGVPRTCT